MEMDRGVVNGWGVTLFFKVMLKRYYDTERYYSNSYNIFDLKSLHLKT